MRTRMVGRRHVLALLTAVTTSAVTGAKTAEASTPWFADVAFGDDALQKFDVYRPEGYAKVPAIVFIHGGGWWNGDKSYVPSSLVDTFTARGIAFVAINYRTLPSAQKAGLFPPLLGPLRDAERALQFLRYHAAQFAIDPTRIALLGESAGGFDALWLGLGPDRADAAADDPVARQSTRVSAIGTIDAQTSIDPAQMRAWVGPKLRYGGHAFGLAEADFDTFLTRREEFKNLFRTLSPAALVDGGAPPLFLLQTHPRDDSATDPSYFVHSPGFGIGFSKLAKAKGAPVTLRIDPSRAGKDALTDFLASAVSRKPRMDRRS